MILIGEFILLTSLFLSGLFSFNFEILMIIIYIGLLSASIMGTDDWYDRHYDAKNHYNFVARHERAFSFSLIIVWSFTLGILSTFVFVNMDYFFIGAFQFLIGILYQRLRKTMLANISVALTTSSIVLYPAAYTKNVTLNLVSFFCITLLVTFGREILIDLVNKDSEENDKITLTKVYGVKMASDVVTLTYSIALLLAFPFLTNALQLVVTLMFIIFLVMFYLVKNYKQSWIFADLWMGTSMISLMVCK